MIIEWVINYSNRDHKTRADKLKNEPTTGSTIRSYNRHDFDDDVNILNYLVDYFGAYPNGSIPIVQIKVCYYEIYYSFKLFLFEIFLLKIFLLFFD